MVNCRFILTLSIVLCLSIPCSSQEVLFLFDQILAKSDLSSYPLHATREFSVGYCVPGETVEIQLEITNPNNIICKTTIKESIPQGWDVIKTTKNDVQENGRIMWNYEAPPGTSYLTYSLCSNHEFHDMSLFSGQIDSHDILGSRSIIQTITDEYSAPKSAWRYWTEEDGLPASEIIDVKIAPTGNIILNHGSEGISILDGYSLNVIPAPYDDYLVQSDPHGTLWSVSRDWKYGEGPKFAALHEFLDGEWLDYHTEELQSPISCWDFVPLTNRQFVLYYENHLRHYDQKTNTAARVKDVVPTGFHIYVVTYIDRAPNGEIWFLSGKSVLKVPSEKILDPTDYVEYKCDIQENLKYFYSFIRNPQNGLTLIGINKDWQTASIFHFQDNRWQILHETSEEVTNGHQDEHSDLWLTKWSTLSRIDREGNEEPIPRIVNSGMPTQMLADSSGALWVTLDEGIGRKIPKQLWRTPSPFRGLQKDVFAIREDGEGRIWILYEDRLACYQDQRVEMYRFPEGTGIGGAANMWLPRIHVWPDGILSISRFSWKQIITHCRFDPVRKKFSWQRDFHVHQFSPKDNGHLWIGSIRNQEEWIEEYDGERYRKILKVSDFPFSAPLLSIFKTNTHDLMIGTYDGIRLYKNLNPPIHDTENTDIQIDTITPSPTYDGEQYKILPFEDGYAADHFDCFVDVEKSGIWVACSKGIFAFDGEQWCPVRTGIGRVRSIIKASDQSIWIATSKGVYQYTHESWIQYTMEDGLPGNSVYCVYEDSQKRIWAGTTRGLSLFDPEADCDPPVTTIPIETNASQKVIVPDGMVQISYTGMDKWKNTETIRLLFSTQLDDESWSPFTSNTVYSVTGLAGGLHRLQVRCMDRNLNIDPTPEIFEFTVMLPWYKQWGFLTILLLGSLITLTALGYAISRHLNLESLVSERTRQLQALASEISLTEERERRKIATDLHDRIGHGLATCQMQVELAQNTLKSEDSTRDMLAKTRDIIKQTIKDARTLTVEISPPALYELGLDPAVKWLVDQMNKQYEMRIRCMIDGTPQEIGEDERGILYRAIRECLFNTVKHAQTREALVAIAYKKNAVSITVEDHGAGFDSTKFESERMEKQSFGLFSLRERIHYIGGRFECFSERNKGTRITIQLPLRKNEKNHETQNSLGG